MNKMEPSFKTDPKLLPVLEELKKREPIFHRPEYGTTRKDFEDMTKADYWEVGASGNIYSRENVLDVLEERYKILHEDVWEAKDFCCMEISENNYLITYTLVQDNSRVTRRATIWRRHGTVWKIVYHQGTIVKE